MENQLHSIDISTKNQFNIKDPNLHSQNQSSSPTRGRLMNEQASQSNTSNIPEIHISDMDRLTSPDRRNIIDQIKQLNTENEKLKNQILELKKAVRKDDINLNFYIHYNKFKKFKFRLKMQIKKVMKIIQKIKKSIKWNKKLFIWKYIKYL